MPEEVQSFLNRNGMISLIIGVALQTAGIVWWAASASAKLQAVADSQAKQEQSIDKMRQIGQDISERLTRVQVLEEDLANDILKYHPPMPH